LGDWYATVLFWRPQVVLVVNEATLVPLLMPLAPAATVLDRLPAEIAGLLVAHRVDNRFVVAEQAAMTPVGVAPTANRSVVGTMNDFALLAGRQRRAGEEDLVGLSMRLAHTPCGPLASRHGFPDRELAAVVASAVGPDS
jgi:hypothetical protein